MTGSASRLRFLAGINTHVLSETTDPGFEFRYIDIGSVGRGHLVAEPETMVFEGAPSRARRVIRAGDCLVSTVRTYLRAVLPVRAELDGAIASTGFAVLTPGPRLEPRYLGWVAQSDPFIEEIVARSTGVSYPAINALEIGDLEVPTPPLDQQRAIADYLDTETARIDALLAKKRRLAGNIEMRHLVAVERIVLGLDLRAAPAHSSFFSHAPSRWGETLLRHLRCEVQTGPFGSQLHAEEYVEGGWPVVNPANLTGGRITPIATMAVSDEKRTELARHILRTGDIVFGRRGEMGRAGLVGDNEAGWLCGTGSLRLRVRDTRLDSAYLKLALETAALRRYFDLTSVGSTMDNLNSEIILGVPVLIPPLEEQRSIVQAVGGLEAGQAALRAALDRQVGLLAEHRQALITAAVTGELEIPGVAA